jgi:FlaA1/EpsC-like NDP-sugar epimerase
MLSSARRIVVYSSGSFGQHVVSAIRQLGQHELVGWIDEDDNESQRSGLAVSSIDSILGLDFDVVLVAAIDSEYSKTVARRLASRGISGAKISRLNVDFDLLDAQLRKIGFDTESFAYSGRVE